MNKNEMMDKQPLRPITFRILHSSFQLQEAPWYE